MSENLPNQSPETENPGFFQMITAKLEEFQITLESYPNGANFLCDSTDLHILGYEQLNIYLFASGVVTVDVVYLPGEGKQKADRYEYKPDEQSVSLETMTKNHTIQITALKRDYIRLGRSLDEFYERFRGSKLSMIEDLPDHPEYISFAKAYMQRVTAIADWRKSLTDAERLSIVDETEAENEKSLIAFFEGAAAFDQSFEVRLEDYRKDLLYSQEREFELQGRAKEIARIEDIQTTQAWPADPEELAKILEQLSQTDNTEG